MTGSAATSVLQFHDSDMSGGAGTRIGHGAQRAPIRWLALAVLFSAPSAESAEYEVNYANADTGRWACRLCEFEKATARTGRLAAGALNATGSEMRFGRDNGIDRSGGYLDLNADFHLATPSGFLLDLTARDLGLDARDAALSLRKPKRYGLQVRYRETPRNVARDTRSPFTGNGTLSLPPDWVPAFSTAAMTQLGASSDLVRLATKRRRLDIGAWYNLTPGLTVRTGYFHEAKRGVDATSRDFFYQATALPQTIDYRVDGAEAGLRYEAPALSLAITYAHRRFRNGEDALVWDNPYVGVVPSGESATAPDNKATTLSLVANARIGRRTRLNATLIRNEAKQDAPFLPYTSNASIDLAPIDETSLDANRESLSAAVNLVSRPTPRLRLSVAHAVADRRDRRRNILLTPVLGDLFATAPINAVGYDYKRSRTDIALRYRVARHLRVASGYRNLDNRRTNLEIRGNDEHRGWLEVTGELGAGWQARVKYVLAERDAAEFLANSRNNPLTRRFYQAERRHSEWSGGVRFDSDATGFSIGLDANRRKHNYPDSLLGLQRDTSTGWTMDIAYTPGKAACVSGFYGVQSRKSRTAGSAAFPTRDWWYDLKDKVTTAGARFAVKGFPHPALDFSVDYAHSDGIGDYETALDDARSIFPGLISRHRSVDVQLRHAWRPRTSLVLRYYYERYRAADWAIDGLGQDAIRNVLTLGRSSPRYGNHLIALSVKTSF